MLITDTLAQGSLFLYWIYWHTLSLETTNQFVICVVRYVTCVILTPVAIKKIQRLSLIGGYFIPALLCYFAPIDSSISAISGASVSMLHLQYTLLNEYDKMVVCCWGKIVIWIWNILIQCLSPAVKCLPKNDIRMINMEEICTHWEHWFFSCKSKYMYIVIKFRCFLVK